MVFDKNCHFSMALTMPICAQETDVTMLASSELNLLEDLCKKHAQVAYISDSTFSLGGLAHFKELQSLQDRYGLFLYLDDSHAISIFGKRGQGVALSEYGSLNDRTMVIGSLAKGFGATGGFIAYQDPKVHFMIDALAGPLGWSQEPNAAAMGAVLGSIEVHQSSEITVLQEVLHQNISAFDQHCESSWKNAKLPVRTFPTESLESAASIAEKILKEGFYVSPIFFPIVEKGKSGLRVLLRSDVATEEVIRLAKILDRELGGVKK